MVEIKMQLDNDDFYDNGNDIQFIVIHDTGNETDSDEANANYFCSGTRNASAHYFVDDDSITQLILDYCCAFHVGDGHGAYGITNRNSLGIEMCRQNNTVTETTENNTIELVKVKMKEYNVPIERVVRHYDASRKSCPESFMANDWERWYEFKDKLSHSLESEGDNMRLPDNWDDEKYLNANPDVKTAVDNGAFKDGADHWLQYGYREPHRYLAMIIPNVVETIAKGV
jgi:N-acetylmuramoyl-L-alanine amidase